VILVPKHFLTLSVSNLTGLTNGWIVGSQLTNIISLMGTNRNLYHGIYWNPTNVSPYLSNATAYGISAPGGGTGSEQFGSTATATTNNATAIGNAANAGNHGVTAAGQGITATGYRDTGYGHDNSMSGGRGALLGYGNEMTATNGLIIGSGNTVTHADSGVIGFDLSSEATNTLKLWRSDGIVHVPGYFKADNATNMNVVGTNRWQGDLSVTAGSYASLANGTNIIGALDYWEVKLGGSLTADSHISGAQGGRTAKAHKYYNNTGYKLNILHESGLATDTYRIKCPSGLDRVVPVGGSFELHYFDTENRWYLRNVWPDDTGFTTTLTVTADNWALTTTNVTFYRIKSNDSTASNRTLVLSSGQYVGQELVMEAFDTSNAWEIVDDAAVTGGGNVRLGSTFSSSQYDMITLKWNGTDWIEKGRSVN
jgi:hypothetical protein